MTLMSKFHTELTGGRRVVVSVAWLAKANAEKLKLKIQDTEFFRITVLNKEIAKEPMIRAYEVTNIASPRIDVKPGKLILLYIYS